MQKVGNKNAAGSRARSLLFLVGIFVLTFLLFGFNRTACAGTKDWMKDLPDRMQISQINIPGTHDSGCRHIRYLAGFGSKDAQTQDWDIGEQLEHGIRVFDIRLGLHDDDDMYDLRLCHGITDCYTGFWCFEKLTLNMVLETVGDFLAENPSETVVLMLREEDDQKRTNKMIWDIMLKHDHKNTERPSEYPWLVSYFTGETVPSLYEVRGKAVCLCKKQPDGSDYSSNLSYTEYETSYEWYGDEDKDDYADPELKVEMIKWILENQTHAQNYFDKYDTFSSYGEQKAKRGYTGAVRAPMMISTNLTQIRGFTTSWLNGPRQCWEHLYNEDHWYSWPYTNGGFKNVSLESHHRIGWWEFDFPQDHHVQDLINSNRTQVEHYQIRLKKDDVVTNDTIRLIKPVVTSSHGDLEPIRDWHYDRVSGEYVLDYGNLPASTLKNTKISVEIGGTTYYGFLSSRDNVKRDDWYTQIDDHYILITGNEISTRIITVWFEGDTGTGLRPDCTPQAFIENIGFLYFKNNRYLDNHTFTVSQYDPSVPLRMIGTHKTTKNSWSIGVYLPKYINLIDTNWELAGLAYIQPDCPYVVTAYDKNNLYLKLKDPNERTWERIQYIWHDNFNAKKWRYVFLNALRKNGIRHVVLDPLDNSVVTDEILKEDQIDVYTDLLATSTQVDKYVPGTYRKAIHRFSIPDTYENFEITPLDGTEFSGTYLIKPLADIVVEVEWDDRDNVQKLRPGNLDFSITDLLTGISCTGSIAGVEGHKISDNLWNGSYYCPVYPDQTSADMVDFENFGFSYDITVPGYDVSVTCTQGRKDKLDKFPLFTFRVTCTVKAPEDRFADIEGAIIWNDGDLVTDHSSLTPEIRVLRDCEEMTLVNSKLKLAADRTSYTFEPNTDFPEFKDDWVTAYQYDVDPQPVAGYLSGTLQGYDVTYVKQISVSGTVKWVGKRPVATPPEVRLIRGGETVCGSAACGSDGTFMFAGLPIADTDGIPYDYSVEVYVPGVDEDSYTVNYTVKRDANSDGTGTGNFTASVVLTAVDKPVSAEIPVRLVLEEIEPEEVMDDFTFMLYSDDDPDFVPRYLTLNSRNGFEDTFVIENVRDNIERTYYVIQTDTGRNACWYYDEETRPVTVSLRFLNGTAAAQTDMGGADHLEFTNIYIGNMPVIDLPVWVEWENSDIYKADIPESIRADLYANGVKQTSVTVTAADGWSCCLEDLPVYDLVPSNGKAIRTPVEYTLTAGGVEGFDDPVIKGDAETGFTVYYTVPAEKREIEVHAEWELVQLYTGELPESIDVTLLADGTEVRSAKITAADGWTLLFKDLPSYGPVPDGGSRPALIEYTLTAEEIEGFIGPEITGSAAGGFTVYYSLPSETMDTEVRILWEGLGTSVSKAPDSVRVTLLANGIEAEQADITAGEKWLCRFTGLPVNGPVPDGGSEPEPIRYTLTAENLENFYEAVITGDAGTGFTVTYEAPAETRDIDVLVDWDFGQRDGLMAPDAVTVTLLADGDEVKTAKVTAAEGWAYRFATMPSYGPAPEGGTPKLIEYTLIAEEIRYFDEPVITGSAAGGFTVTYAVPGETRDVDVLVVWKSNEKNSLKAPGSVCVTLLADGKEADRLLISAGEKWYGRFTDLPSRGPQPADGGYPELIDYTVTAESIENFDGPVITGDDANGFEVTYTASSDIVDIKVSIEWIDQNKTPVPRPSTVRTELFADGSSAGVLNLSSRNGWSGTFPNMPMTARPTAGRRLLLAAGGRTGPKAVVYKLTADEIPGFFLRITGNARDGFNVTYTAKPVYPPTGDSFGLWPMLGLLLLSAAGTAALTRRRRRVKSYKL